jgi:hypothetical protein
MAAAQRMNIEMHFMRNVNGCVTVRTATFDYSKGLQPPFSLSPVMPPRHTP